MSNENKKKQIIKISVFITSLFVIFLSVTYAFINMTLVGTKRQVITAGNLELQLQEDENNLTIQNAMPMYDEVGMLQKAFTFRLINKTEQEANYIIKLIDITTGEELSSNIIKYGLTKDGVSTIGMISDLKDLQIDEGIIEGKQIIEYSLRLWIDSSVEDESLISGKSLSYRIDIEAVQSANVVYQEEILNGCDPILSDNLVPVVIEDDGTVKKANIYQKWYNYTNQKWANAIVLEDKTLEYTEGQIIPEENIQSYFVWIPRYKYKLFDMGDYNSLSDNLEKKEQTIEVVFESKEVSPVVGTKVGDYHSHPAFQAFDTNGFWVGKFESGYKGATSIQGAHQNNSNSSNLIIKPNVYSWRNISVGNSFKVSYDYLREDESHMMKNTEWGAVAYLQHSEYGSRTSVRVNNNSSYLTGYAAVVEPTLGYNNGVSVEENQVGTDASVTQPYNTLVGYTASTTRNITGIYDMSGGSWEYVMGYNTNASTVGGNSGLTSIYEDFFTNSKWGKYYDKYSSTSDISYNNRILGDATGEMGLFANITDSDASTRHRTSWYGDLAHFVIASHPWFKRGGHWSHGSGNGIFAFHRDSSDVVTTATFRVVLAI